MCNQNEVKVKKVLVVLSTSELNRLRRRIVVQVPLDCDDREIKEPAGDSMDELADTLPAGEWEVVDTDTSGDVDVEVKGSVPDDVEADLMLVRNEDDELVIDETAT